MKIHMKISGEQSKMEIEQDYATEKNSYKCQVAEALADHNLETATILHRKQEWPFDSEMFLLQFANGDNVSVPERFVILGASE